ncbi:hypothetical protein D3C83_70830 [compost metagenome]
MKLKSLRLTNAYPDRPRNSVAVPASASITSCGPLEKNVRYAESSGPSVRPMKPVSANTAARPQALLRRVVVRYSRPK